MLASEKAQLLSRPQLSGAGYECYLRVRQEIALWTKPALDRAIQHLHAALEITGESGFLLASLAQVYAAYVGGGFRLDEETRRTAERYATRALALNPALAPAHCALGNMAFMRANPKLAFVHLKRALAIGTDAPNAVYLFVLEAARVCLGLDAVVEKKHIGRSGTGKEIRDLIQKIASANPLWGSSRVHGGLLKLGIHISERTVARLMPKRKKPPSQTWRVFLDNHLLEFVSIDLLVVPMATFRILFALIVLAHDRRRVVDFNVILTGSNHITAAMDFDKRQVWWAFIVLDVIRTTSYNMNHDPIVPIRRCGAYFSRPIFQTLPSACSSY